ncbi:hypothetical protein DEU56DRAFT_228337 [Suillus clintonianus]|uniref:uncharacterized protein n=1 Tax=Suillus clintonianus TaxID=1904413 RepID=UPI001B865C97|nr:uncharacterized protein DEU56DRAFT_228337 [Suillus clintonianus]KAG2156293.1 hypothetical protein DEU56DRAFT_228337 [Suillus clintonianus]
MGVEASRPPAAAPIGSSETPMIKVANIPQAPCATALSAASSGDVTPGHIQATSVADATTSRNKEGNLKATVIAPAPNNVKLNASSAVDAVSAFCTSTLNYLIFKFHKIEATCREASDLDCASVTRQEQEEKCDRDFCVPDSAPQGHPSTSGNEAVIATGSGAPGNVNQPLLSERKLSVTPKAESAPVEHPANNSLDSISSTIIPESFEASEPPSRGRVQQPFANIQSNDTQRHVATASIESSLSPCKNRIVIPDVASTNIISSVLKSATEYSIENTGRTYTSTPIKTKNAGVPVAVTYADATNLAARYPDLASQILVSPLRKRTASQEVALIPEQDLIEESPPSGRRRPRNRRHRRKRSRDNQEASQQQSRGSLGTPGPGASPSRHKDHPSSASGTVDPKETSRFHYAQANWSVDSASPTPNPAVERAPSLQTNRHTILGTLQERTHDYQRESSDVNWVALAAEMQPSTPSPTRFATLKREQHNTMHLKGDERAGTTKATDSTTTSLGRRSSNAEMLLTELFRKAMETSSPSATKVRYTEHSPLRKSQAEGPTPVNTLVTETAYPVNQAEKIIEGDSPRVKLPVSSTPVMKTSTSKSPTAQTEEHQTVRQSYKPPAARMQENTVFQSYKPPAARTAEDYTTPPSYKPPAARTEENYTTPPSYKPPAARTTEDHTIHQNYKPPHQRLNENNQNATATQKPHIYHASPLNRQNPCTPPSPRSSEILERSERIRYLERLLSRERDLPINITGLDVPSPKAAQALQPIGPWRASDEKAFHEHGAINPGTSANQSLDLMRAMQAMGLDISPRTDGLASLGSGNESGRRPSAVERNGFSGVRRRSGTMTTEDTVLRTRTVPSQGLRSPRGGGGYRSVSGQSMETNVPVTQFTGYR